MDNNEELKEQIGILYHLIERLEERLDKVEKRNNHRDNIYKQLRDKKTIKKS